ncbi:MAG: iron complex transport system substrate-binding protein [Thiomicrorhabdus sp.]|nr:MAG: iron complex transport system substrate-binding protein [Thiomicrorhabdus sp.]
MFNQLTSFIPFTVQTCLVLCLGLVTLNNASAQQPTSESNTAQRIIALAPHITEMLYSAGAGDQIVGVVSYSDYPEDALSKPIIGGYNAINLEKIIELNPDLILGWQSGNRAKDLQRLKELGFTVSVFEIEQLDDIPNRIEQLGIMTGNVTKAKKSAAQLRSTLKQVREANQYKSKITSFYEIWHKPLITMNGQQFISQAMAVCGAENIYTDLKPLTAQISVESLFERNPQLFLLGGRAAFQKDWLKSWQSYTSLKAVQNKQIYLLNNSHYQRPTARLINALAPLCDKVDQARAHYGQ